MGFLYDVFQLSGEGLSNSDLYNTDCIHTISCSVNYNTFDWDSGHRKEFPNLEYLGIVPVKLENQLIANF